jgi:putative membrane protein
MIGSGADTWRPPSLKRGGKVVVDLAAKVVINAIGVFAAIQVIPQIEFNYGGDWWKLLAVALILALVNTYVKPIAKVLSFPVTLLSLGLFTFVLNAGILLLVTFISDLFQLGFTIGGFPPDFTADSFVGALLGSIVISIVSMLLGMVNTGRRIIA